MLNPVELDSTQVRRVTTGRTHREMSAVGI